MQPSSRRDRLPPQRHRTHPRIHPRQTPLEFRCDHILRHLPQGVQVSPVRGRARTPSVARTVEPPGRGHHRPWTLSAADSATERGALPTRRALLLGSGRLCQAPIQPGEGEQCSRTEQGSLRRPRKTLPMSTLSVTDVTPRPRQCNGGNTMGTKESLQRILVFRRRRAHRRPLRSQAAAGIARDGTASSQLTP